MLLILPSASGVRFATPDRPIYRDRMRSPDQLATTKNFSLTFGLQTESLRDLDFTRAPHNAEQQFTLVEAEADSYFRTLKRQWGPLKLAGRTRSEVPVGRLGAEGFVPECHVAAVTMTVVRSFLDLDTAPFQAVVSCSALGTHVRENRVSQLWYGMMVLFPAKPPRYGIVQLRGPEIPHELSASLDPGASLDEPFPGVDYFDRIGEGAAAVMSMVLDGARFIVD